MPNDAWIGYPLIFCGLASYEFAVWASEFSMRSKIILGLFGVAISALFVFRAVRIRRAQATDVASAAESPLTSADGHPPTPLGLFKKRMDELIASMKKIKATTTMDNLYSKNDEMIAWEKQMRRDLYTAFGEDGYYDRRSRHHMVMDQAQVDPMAYKQQSNRLDAFANFMKATDGFVGLLEAVKAETLAEHFSPHYQPEDLGK